MAFVKMKPPVGVTVGLGADGKLYYVDQRGFANVDSGSVSKLTSEGWTSVTDSPPGKSLDSVFAQVDPVTGVVINSAGSVSYAPEIKNTGLVRTVALGDSQTRNLMLNGTVSAASRTNGVVSLTVAGHVLATGQNIDVYNMADPSYNAFGVIGTKVDANTISYPAPGPDGSTTALGGASGTVSVMMLAYPGWRDASYWTWLNSLCRGAGNLVRNAGSNGHTAADMLARFDTDVSTIDHDHLIIWAGSNDFAVAATARTAEAVYADVKSMIAKSKASRITVVSAAPYGAGSWNANGRVQAIRYNRMMRNYCNASKRVRFADAAAKLVDATNATAFYPLSTVVGADGLHLSPYGQYLVALSIYNANKDWLPSVDRLVSCNKDNYGADSASINIFDVGPWTSSGGAIAGTTTGTAASGLGVTGTGAACAASVLSRSDGAGYDQVADITFSASSDSVLIGNQGYVTINTGRANAGDRLKFLGELGLSGVNGSNLKGVDVGIKFNTSPSVSVPVFGLTAATAAGFPQVDQTIFLESPDIIVPAGATGYTLQATAKCSAAGTQVRVKLGRMSLDNLSKLSL